MSLSSILAHYGGGDRIVAADADTKNKTKTDEPPNIGREGAGDRSRSENQHFDTVNPLAAEHVRDSAKKQRAQSCSQQSSGLDQTLFYFNDLPHGFKQRHHHTDDEKIIGVGKKSHARDKHDLPVFFGDLRIIHFGKIGLPGIDGCDHVGLPRSTLDGCLC